jgi:branched-chain amino acid transport system ATP-binding protein
MTDIALKIDNLSLSFGGIHALEAMSMTVVEGSIHALVGPNGAGKTSLLNCINGFQRPHQGSSIEFDGVQVVGRRPHHIAKLGIGRTFQNIELFHGSTVLENLLVGRHIHMPQGLLADAIYLGTAAKSEAHHRACVEEVIELLEIGPFRHHAVENLSYGKQKLVEIGRALAMEPKLLLLDEPVAGMNRDEKEDVARFVLRIQQELGMTQVLIEHDVRFVSDLAGRVTVINRGQLVTEGTPSEALVHPAVVEAFLGIDPEASKGVARVS